MNRAPAHHRTGLSHRHVLIGIALLLLMAIAVGAITLHWLEANGEQRTAERQSMLLDERGRQIEEQVRLRRDAVVQTALRLGAAETLMSTASLEDKANADSLVKALFDVMIVTDAAGQVIFDSPVAPGRRGTWAPDRDRFEQQLSRPGGAVTGPVAARAADDQMLTFVAPVRSPTGRPIGLLAASVSLSGTRAVRAFGPSAIGGGGFMLATRETPPRPLMKPQRRCPAMRSSGSVTSRMRRGP